MTKNNNLLELITILVCIKYKNEPNKIIYSHDKIIGSGNGGGINGPINYFIVLSSSFSLSIVYIKFGCLLKDKLFKSFSCH